MSEDNVSDDWERLVPAFPAQVGRSRSLQIADQISVLQKVFEAQPVDPALQ